MSTNLSDTGRGLTPGSRHYRAWIGAPETYDLFSHMQFSLMTLLGLREEHTLLDIGCGSLRGGRLFIVYLLAKKYCGIELEEWLVREGLTRELGAELVDRKQPRFRFAEHFPCTAFGERFDYLLAQSIFSHASVEQIRECFVQARAAMHDESIFAASFVEGAEDYKGDAWMYPGCVEYQASTIERLARDAGLASQRLDWFHSGGQAWFIFFDPGLTPRANLLGSLNQAAMLQIEMTHYRARSARLAQLESHPLLRFAFAGNRMLRQITGRYRRSRGAFK